MIKHRKVNLNLTKIYHILSKFFPVILIVPAVLSCSKSPIREDTSIVTPPPVNKSYEHGIFVVNEGNYNWGNASVTFINTADTNIEQDVFKNHNDRALGDVAESMMIVNDKGYILVNNSNTVEVVSLKNFTSVRSITGFHSPRFMAIIDSSRAYVTNMQQDISVIDLNSMNITKSITTGSWTESLIRYNNFMFVTSIGMVSFPTAQRNAMVLVIDTKSDMIIDTIKTGKEPTCMVMDKKDKIWVLCTGGYDHVEEATLLRIDPTLRVVDKTYTFPDLDDTPSRLCINASKDTLYFLNNGVCQMPVTATSLPASPLIAEGQHLFYGLAIQPTTGNVFVSDALDYVQNGIVYQYNQTTGSMIRSFPAGKIPGSFCFTATPEKK
jgi:hypothetical protein